jgi:phage terminase small subunit
MEETSGTPERVEELPPDEEPAEIYQPGDSIDETQMMLTPTKRKEIIGRLAEFEYQLAALSPLMQGFVLAYLQDPTNLSACARRAGYAEGSAKVKASQLMADSRIQAVIALGQLLREDRTMVTAERTINELAIIAFSNIGDYEVRPGTNQVVTREGAPEYALRAVSQAEYTTTAKEDSDGNVTTTYKVKIKLWSKTDALRMLAMYQRLLQGDTGGTIINNDNSTHVHKHDHHTWKIGDKELNF